MPSPDEHADLRKRIAVATAAVAADRWAQVDPSSISRSWAAQLPTMTASVSAAQFAVADEAEDYLDEYAEPAGVMVDPQGFAGQASDGGALASLLYQPAINALMAIGSGASVDRALAGGGASLDMIVRTQVADAGRAADQAALTTRPQVQGYVRQIVGATCARCTILAGRFYRWNAGFQRHPRCDCTHVPANRAQWRETGRFHDPQQVYDSLSVAQRQRAGWSLADQQAISDGADLIATTNMKGVTTAGTRRSVGKLTPDQIYKRAAGNRDEAIRLLRQNGYLRGAPVVRVPVRRGDLVTAANRPAAGAAKATTAKARTSAVRPVLEQARTAKAVTSAFTAEVQRITGRKVYGYFSGSAATAREHAEGLLRGLERFPRAGDRFRGFGGYRAGIHDSAYAVTFDSGRIEFGEEWTLPASRQKYLRSLAKDTSEWDQPRFEFGETVPGYAFHPRNTGTPLGVAIHEFGHLLDISAMSRSISVRTQTDRAIFRRVEEVTREIAARRKALGLKPFDVKYSYVVRREISEYAAKNTEELLAEAFADVMVNGAQASRLSREIFEILETEYRRLYP